MWLRLITVLVLVAVVLAGLGVVSRVRLRRPDGALGTLPPGLTLVTSSGCAECVRAAAALDDVGARYAVVDASRSSESGIETMSVPVAVVGSSKGEPLLVRRGTAIAADALILWESAAVVDAPG
jgi:glutaredoxin